MPRVFISYRRDDARGAARRLSESLRRRLGSEQVFLDDRDIAYGVDFPTAISDEIRRCDSLLAVIGPSWLTARDEHGGRRLDRPDDWVRIELEAALTAHRRTIPVLVDGAMMPAEDELPTAIASLARRNAITLESERWDAAVDELARSLRPKSAAPLPSYPTLFIGRERDRSALAAILAQHPPILTLTGPGGTGKTRLAAQAAADTADAFSDGVWWVSLAPLADPAAMRGAVADVLGCGDGHVATRLAGRSALIVLDNAEHLLPAAALTIAALVEETPGCTWLVTTRERLRVSAERTYPVAPLDSTDAQRLFAARAHARGVDIDTKDGVEELCERLDYLPLAIELAAGRVGMLSVEQLSARLGDRLDRLRGDRDAMPRHQTLRAAIDWSWSLLEAAEQRGLARLSVFPNGARIEESERVSGADPDVIASLLDKNLLRRRDDPDGAARFALLETIRQYSAERLAATGETDATIAAHTAWALELAGAEQGSDGHPMHLATPVPSWHAADLAAALERLAATDPVRLVDYAGSLYGVPWLLLGSRAAIEAAPNSLGRVITFGVLAFHATWRGELAEARAIADRAIEDANNLGDPYAIVVAVGAVMGVALSDNRIGDPVVTAVVAAALSMPAMRDERWPNEKAHLLQWEAAVATVGGDHVHAERVSLEIHRLGSIGPGGHMWGLLSAAEAALEQRATARAARYLRDALPSIIRTENLYDTVVSLRHSAVLAVQAGRDADGARLAAASDARASERVVAIAPDAHERQKWTNLHETLRDRLGASYSTMIDEGQRLHTATALTLALDVARSVAD